VREPLIASVSLSVLLGGVAACDEGPRGASPSMAAYAARHADAGVLPDGGSAGGGMPVSRTPAERQLAWVLEAINVRRGGIDEAELREHFTSRFLESGPLATRLATLQFFALDMGPLTVLEIQAESSATELLAELDGLQAYVHVRLVLEPDSGLIDELQLTERADLSGGRPASWEEVDADLGALAPRATYLMARVGDAECAPLHGREVDERHPIAGTAHLYVLAALGQRIDAGELAWSDTVVVRDALRLPNGLGDVPDGTPLTLLELASRMIARGDGGATDHLIDFLGREAVEAALDRAGHGAPEVNRPFLMTREAGLLKRDLEAADVSVYLDGDETARREFLEDLAGRAPTRNFVPEALVPQFIDDIEWYASATELCRVMVYLDELADRPGLAEIRDVLSMNTYFDLDRAIFPSIQYQGGAEPGVRHMSWLVRNAEGERYFLSVGVNNPELWIPLFAYLTIPLGMFDLLAGEP
jgi:hypothetical protein